ncbi:unnamed protein product [Schistosoma mattheei]|uniref:Uncharacterized protein n=1 Tax=Schistosoma mattheei TaxID=31246 RepID=A0A183PFW4_9TREM|nr:unnamed protein product [Schistosoma mattheei]
MSNKGPDNSDERPECHGWNGHHGTTWTSRKKRKWVLLNRTKGSVDAQLRDQQAGFCKDRSYTDQITTVRIIVEQSTEWDSSLYINFIHYEKAFDSVNTTTSWRPLRQYGVPEIIDIIRNSYDGLNCRLVRSKVQYQARLLTLTHSRSPSDRLGHEDVKI